MSALDSFKGTVLVSLSLTGSRTVTATSSISSNPSFKFSYPFKTGATGQLEANEVSARLRTLAASGTENVDLAGGLTNVVGDSSITFARVKVFGVKMVSPFDDETNGTLCSGMKIGGHATAAWTGMFVDATDKIELMGGSASAPGGAFIWVSSAGAGKTVTATTADLVKMENLDATYALAYYLVVVGAAT